MTSELMRYGECCGYDKVLRDITTYVFHYRITNTKALEHSRMALLDSLGCAIETLSTSAECVNLIGPVVPGTSVPNGFKLPGTIYQLDPVKGAFDLGSLIRYLDHNDAYGGAEWGHPSDNIGALLSVADWISRQECASGESPPTTSGDISVQCPKMTMRKLLEAIIKAYEVQGCLQELNSFNAVGLDHTILVKLASTAVVSWLLGCSEAQALAALSQACQDGHPLRTFRQYPNTGPRKGWAAGDACMRAVQMAILSRKGQPGAPTVLSDPNWGFYTCLFRGNTFRRRREYASWVIENIFFKLVPAEGHAISAVEAALRMAKIVTEEGVNILTDVARIRIRTQGPAYTIINKSGPLRNAADRDHCLQYIVAVVLLKGQTIDIRDYADDSPWASDKRVDEIRAKIEVLRDEQFTKDYYDPEKRTCSNSLAVELANGTWLKEILVERPIGGVDRPETLELVESKFKKNAGLIFQGGQIEEMVKAIESEDAPVHRFVDLFHIDDK
ncbi:MAG: hypothetical protein LQ343_001503 [Gyalolechia ehrenbergii]|nr:MAG: hypothetical protein LQ343_001503 [Gyalolechia ehrenbergii]